MPSFLFLDAKTGSGGTACAAFSYANASPTQLGNDFGTSYGGGSANGAPRNGLVQFIGELYGMAQDGVYSKDDPSVTTGNWTSQISFTSPDASNPRFSGLFPVVVGGDLQLVGVFGDSGATNDWRWVKFDGTSWSQASSATTVATITLMLDAIVYRGVLHVLGLDGSGNVVAITFDPSTNSFSNPSMPNQLNRRASGLCMFEDRLFGIFGNNSDATDAYLMEFSGGSWTSLGEIADIGNVQIEEGKWCLFSDGTEMFAILADSGDDGVEAFRGTQDSFPWTDITSTVVPAALQGGTYGGLAEDVRVFAVYDQDSDPTSAPDIYIYHADGGTSGTSFTVYQWNGPAAVMTSVDSGGDVFHSPPSTYPQGGCRIFTAGELDVTILSRSSALGGEQQSFKAAGGGTGRIVKGYYAEDEESPLTRMTFKGPVTGGSATFNSGSNQVENVAADGSTTYTVVWDFEADGVNPNTVAQRFLEITT